MMSSIEASKQEPSQELKTKRINPLGVLLVLGLLAILPVSLFLVKQSQEIRKEAAEPKNTPTTKNQFSFNLHAPYNTQGNLTFPSLIDSAFLDYIDTKIKDLEKDNPGAIEIIRNSGKTGLIPALDSVDVSGDCGQKDHSCRNAHFIAESHKGWSFIEGPIDRINAMGKDVMLEVNLFERINSNVDNAAYLKDKEDIDVLEELVEKALVDRNFKNKVKYWQIGNEPGANKWTSDEKIEVEGTGEVMLLAYATERISKKIKEHCSDCKIVLAGVGISESNNESFYQDFINNVDLDCNYGSSTQYGQKVCGYYKRLIADINLLDPNGQTFDIFDFHYHNQSPQEESVWHKSESRYLAIRNLLDSTNHANIPIWITETSSYSGSPARDWDAYPPRTEQQQAKELVKRYLFPFSLGIEKVFWSPGIIDYGKYGTTTNNYFANVGLIDKDGKEKQSFLTLSILLKHIAGFTSVETVYSPKQNAPAHPTIPKLYQLKFNFQNKPSVFVIWNEIFSTNTPNVDLSSFLPSGAIVLRINNTESGENINSIAINNTPKIIIPAITLAPGANLISIPLTDSTPLADALITIDGEYRKVFTFNNQAKQWKSFDASLPTWANSLANIDQTMGLWVYVDNPTTISFSEVPPTTTIPLYTGANLVGFPSSETKSIEEALSSISGKYTKLFEYDSSVGGWKSFDASLPAWANSLTEMKPGFGYWIYVSEDCNLIITN